MSDKITFDNGITVPLGVLAARTLNQEITEDQDYLIELELDSKPRYQNEIYNTCDLRLSNRPYLAEMTRTLLADIYRNWLESTHCKPLIRLSQRDWKQFIVDIETDEEPSDALKELAQLYKEKFG